MKINLQSFKTYQLNELTILKICKLKNSHWKYNLKLQKNFFNKNAKKYDIHNLLYLNKKLVGYTMLRNRKILKKYKFFIFDTLIIDKKYRGRKFSTELMNFNNNIIKKSNYLAILFCNKDLITFYSKFLWKLQKFKISKNKKYIMSFNNKKSDKLLLSKKNIENTNF